MAGHQIMTITPHSPADRAGVKQGEYLLALDQIPIVDVFDYGYLIQNTRLTLTLEDENHRQREVVIHKAEEEDPGIGFANDLMDHYRSCCNRCLFCFIDQNPRGMRSTIYFKDDDSRLSFLQGNYITLTNMSENEIRRIIRLHLSPINISVHATEPQLRCKLLGHVKAGEILNKIRLFYEAGVEMNAQVVLIPELNDKEHLDRTISDLSQFLPHMRSLSVVPVGVTRHRNGLYPLRTFTPKECGEVVDQITAWQEKLLKEHHTRFVFPSDEFYLRGNKPVPEDENYEGFGQWDNGVGMIRLMHTEFRKGLERAIHYVNTHSLKRVFSVFGTVDKRRHLPCPKREVSIATGRLAYGQIRALTNTLMKYFTGIKVHVYSIRNDFFGPEITVSGLIVGGDLIRQLKDRPLGEELLLPVNMLRSGEDVFLDDMTVGEVEKALQVKIGIVKSSGQDLVAAICGIPSDSLAIREENPYEPASLDYQE